MHDDSWPLLDSTNRHESERAKGGQSSRSHFCRALRSVAVSEDLQLSHSVYAAGIWAATGASCHSQFPSSLFNCGIMKKE